MSAYSSVMHRQAEDRGRVQSVVGGVAVVTLSVRILETLLVLLFMSSAVIELSSIDMI